MRTSAARVKGLSGAALDRLSLRDAFDCALACMEEEKLLIRAVTTGASALFAKEVPQGLLWAFGESIKARDEERKKHMHVMRGRRLQRTMRRLDLTEDEARERYRETAPAIYAGHYVLPTN